MIFYRSLRPEDAEGSEGSKGSKGSEGKVDGPYGPESYGRLTAAGCVEGLCSLRSRGRYRRFAAMSMKTALRDLRLCHRCCRTKCVSPFPADWYLWVLRSLTTCAKILHCVQNDGAGRKVPPQAAEDRGVGSFQNLSDLSSGLRPAPS